MPVKNHNKSIGMNIKAARMAVGLTQKQVADHLRLPFQNISSWERGEAAPALKHLGRLGKLMGVTVDQLTRGRLAHGSSSIGNRKQEETLARVVRRELIQQLATDPRLKLLEAYLEEVISLLRSQEAGAGPADRLQAVTRQFSTDHKLELPGPKDLPRGLSARRRSRWQENLALIGEWARSEHAFWAPSWALQRFCRDADGSFEDTGLEAVSEMLKDYIEEGNK
ncbi:MAG: helix-turn-helix transcriptional regulator [Gemmatimonadota bacterium]|nr:helix-turn-helix transcriptional regulator [Gemmatimonadota bacterium]